MKGLIAFVLTLALCVGGGVWADAMVTERAERGAEAALGQRLGAPAQVALSGWPVSLRLVAGGVPRAEITASDVPLEGTGASIDRIDVVLTDLTVALRDIVAGDPGSAVQASDGTFSALLTPQSLSELIGVRGVRLGDGVLVIEAAGISADVTAAVEGGQVVLRPVGSVPPGAVPVELSLPPLPAGAVVEGVTISGDGLVLRGRVTDLLELESEGATG